MVITAYFLASETELTAACRGWRVPLATPRQKTGTNPFTGEPIMVDDFDPTPGAPFPAASLVIQYAALPNVEIRALDITRLATLMQVLVQSGDWTQCYRPARVGPSEADQAVCKVPPELVSAVATTPEVKLGEVTELWLTALRHEAGAIADEDGRKLVLEGFVTEIFLPALAELRNLARQAVLNDRGMYCFMAP